MDFMNTFRLALRALARNKMRSALTMLGIIIGVGAVIAVVSIGQGAQYIVQQGIQAMGTNAVFIAAGSNRAGGVRQGYGGVKTLTVDDMNAILREIPLIQQAAPALSSRQQVVYGNQNWNTSITGTAPNYFDTGPCKPDRRLAMKRWTSPRMFACSARRSQRFCSMTKTRLERKSASEIYRSAWMACSSRKGRM
jgi:ABC-type lipoprotein release transport system permease subunit